MVDWYLGTMGFSYKDWHSVFYPTDLETRNYLAYYSKIFNAVEVDSTFYGMPRQEVVQRWVAITPPVFKFCVKTPQAITHNLEGIGKLSEMGTFLEGARVFGEKLGVVLIQFPPSFKYEKFRVLADFLTGTVSGSKDARSMMIAVEFRHPSWHAANNEVQALLKDLAVCWASTEYPGLPRVVYSTSSFLYIRWIGQHGSYLQHDHEHVDRTSQLTVWWDHLNKYTSQFDQIFGFFNNDYAGHAPATCNRFKKIAGIPIPVVQTQQQGRLF